MKTIKIFLFVILCSFVCYFQLFSEEIISNNYLIETSLKIKSNKNTDKKIKYYVYKKIENQIRRFEIRFFEEQTSLIGRQNLNKNSSFIISPTEYLTIYPNPCTDALNIREFNDIENCNTILIEDIIGRKIMKIPFDFQIYVNDLVPGKYYIHIIDSSNEMIFSTSFIKNN